MIKFGQKNIKDLYIGEDLVQKGFVGNDLVYVRNTLPYDAEVEYIESTGTQYIDTNYAFTDDYTFEICFSGMTTNSTLFGARASSVRTSVIYYSTSNGVVINMAAYTGSTTPFTLGSTTSNRIIKMSVSQNTGTVWVNNTKTHDNVSFNGSYISNVSQAVFATKYGDNDYRDITTSRIYYLKMWQGETLVRDFIPVRIGQTGYLYDKVNGELYGNIGTGNFRIGNDITYVQYLELTGTQYIATTIKGDQTTEMGVKYRTTLETGRCIAGYRGGTNDNLTLYTGTSLNDNRFGNKSVRKADLLNVDYEVSINKDYLTVDGVTTPVNCTVTFTTTGNILIGAWNKDTNRFNGRFYYFYMKKNGVKILDLVPVKVENIGYMFDLVTRQLYGNSGTGSFIIGPQKQ